MGFTILVSSGFHLRYRSRLGIVTPTLAVHRCAFRNSRRSSERMMPRASRKVASPHVVCVEDLRPLARRRVPRAVFDYLDGGAEGEVTLRENCRTFEDVTFRPRHAVAVSVAICLLAFWVSTCHCPSCSPRWDTAGSCTRAARWLPLGKPARLAPGTSSRPSQDTGWRT